MSEENPTSSKNMGKDSQKSSNSSPNGKQSEEPSIDKSESKEQNETRAKKSETADGQPSCLNLPEFLNKKSQPEFEGVNPRQRRQSELVLPAVGLQRTPPMTPMTAQDNFANSSSSSLISSTSTSLSLPDSNPDSENSENIMTEKIKDPDQLLDTIRAALLTCKNVNRVKFSTSNNNNNNSCDNNTTNTSTSTEGSSNLKEHVDKIILYRNLIEQLSHDHHFRKPTDLLRLEELPRSYGLQCEIWIKCEFQNFSGSSKYRVASLMLAELDLIKNSRSSSCSDSSCSSLNSSTIIIITHTSASFTLALACANVHMRKNYQIISILPDRTSKVKRTILQSMGVKIYRAPEESSDNSQSNESPTMMAKFLSEKIKNSIVLNPFEHPLSLVSHYLWTGREILEQFNSLSEQKDVDIDIDMVVCGYETGGMISGLSPLFKDVNPNCIIVGVDLSGQLKNEEEVKKTPGSDTIRYVDPDTIFVEEYSSPSLCSLLNVKAADKWYHISLKDATNMARTMMLKEGIPVTATSGAVLQAAILAAKEFNLHSKKDAKILLLLDNFALYTDFDLASNEWLISRGYITNLEIEETKWYHLIHCWRIPVKVPVTVFNDFNAAAVYQMMKNDGVERVLVQDAGTNVILGVSTLTNLEKKLQDGSLTQEDLIGDKTSVCTSFQTICINNTISALFELFKTRSYAILVQRQKFISATRGRLDQDWIAGILNIQDLVRFISDIEQKHGEKFGANLCGGFYRAKSTNFNDNDINTDVQDNESKSKSIEEEKEEEEYSNDDKRNQEKSSLVINSEDLVIGSHLKEAIINNMMIANTNEEECSKSTMSMEIPPPPDMSSLDFSASTPGLQEPDSESSTEIISTVENGTDNAYQQAQGSVQTEARRLTAEGAQVSSSGFSTPATFTLDHDSLILSQETNPHNNFYTPTRYHSMHRVENMQNSSTSEEREENDGDATITLSEQLTSDTYLPIGLEYSTMTLGDSLFNAWYSTSTSEPMTISDPASHSSNVLLSDNPISSNNSSDVLLSIQSLPQIRVFNQFNQPNNENENENSQQQQPPQSQNVLNLSVSTIPDRNDDEISNSMQRDEDGGNSNTIVIPTREQEELVAPVLSEQCDPLLNETLLNAFPLVGSSMEATAAEAQAIKFPGQNRTRKIIKEESITVIKTIQSAYRILKEFDGPRTSTNPTTNLVTTPNTKALKDSSSLDNIKSKTTFQDSTTPTSTTNITTSVTTNSSFSQNASSIHK